MPADLDAIPTVARGRLQLDGCVDTNLVHRGPVAQIVYWRCRHEGDALRAERCHSTYVVSLVARGACGVSEGTWHETVDPATALLHRPESPYRTTHPFGCIDSGWNIAYRRDVADDLLERIGVLPGRWDRPSIAVTALPAALGMRQLILMQRHRHGRDVDAVAFEELALELLEAVAGSVAAGTGGGRAATAREHACVVERARQYLNSHFRDSPGLDDIAAAAGAAPAHLCRVFKARLGMPIRGYIHRLRLADALHSATDGAIRLDRAAVDAGFYSHSHLTTVCSRVLGTSPREIRGTVLS